jgi:hypothetical protein
MTRSDVMSKQRTAPFARNVEVFLVFFMQFNPYQSLAVPVTTWAGIERSTLYNIQLTPHWRAFHNDRLHRVSRAYLYYLLSYNNCDITLFLTRSTFPEGGNRSAQRKPTTLGRACPV